MVKYKITWLPNVSPSAGDEEPATKLPTKPGQNKKAQTPVQKPAAAAESSDSDSDSDEPGQFHTSVQNNLSYSSNK